MTDRDLCSDLCEHVYRCCCHLASEDAFSEADPPRVSLTDRDVCSDLCEPVYRHYCHLGYVISGECPQDWERTELQVAECLPAIQMKVLLGLHQETLDLCLRALDSTAPLSPDIFY